MRMQRFLAASLVALVSSAGCGGGEASEPSTSTTVAEPVELSAEFVLYSDGPLEDGDGCDGADIGAEVRELVAGAQVTIRDDRSRIVGTGTLKRGRVSRRPENPGFHDPIYAVCVMPFGAEVAKASFYEVEVGELTHTVKAVDAAAGTVEIAVR
jgi:hypothetical protein